MNKFDGKTANIKVSSMESKLVKNGSTMTKITDENGLKYSFFDKKKDGTPTAASEGFQGVRIGDIIEIGFSEEEKEFQGDSGLVKYTQRTIRFLNPVKPDGNYAMNPNGTYAPGQNISLDTDEGAPF